MRTIMRAVMDSLTHRFSSSKWPTTKQKQRTATKTVIGTTCWCVSPMLAAILHTLSSSMDWSMIGLQQREGECEEEEEGEKAWSDVSKHEPGGAILDAGYGTCPPLLPFSCSNPTPPPLSLSSPLSLIHATVTFPIGYCSIIFSIFYLVLYVNHFRKDIGFFFLFLRKKCWIE